MPTTDVSNEIYVCPDFKPYNDPNFNAVWIHIESKEVKFQTALKTGPEAKVSGGLILGDDGPQWYFLAPEQILETINNSWEPWETIASRLAGKGIEFKQISNDVKAVAGALTSTFRGGNIVSNVFKELSSISKVSDKMDTPLVYQDTDRREWTMQFNLSSNTENNNIFMMSGLKRLRDMSLPVRTEGDYGLGIDLPYVFRLFAELPDGTASDMFDIYTGYCALTSFQPTYMAPYNSKRGDPMRIELTLTFKEISPKYASEHKIVI